MGRSGRKAGQKASRSVDNVRGAVYSGAGHHAAWGWTIAAGAIASAFLSVVVWYRQALPVTSRDVMGFRASPILEVGAQLGVKRPTITQVIPHEESCYTQGLVFNDKDSYLYESCGLYGESLLRRVCPETGNVLATSSKLPKELFAEGIHIIEDELVMLTWKERKLVLYDWKTLERTRVLKFETHTHEGWGIAGNSTMLVVTDGSNWLHYWDPNELREPPTSKVSTRAATRDLTRNTGELRGLNEIEFVSEHELLANVYGWEVIARIDARSGLVAGYYDFRGTLKDHGDPSGRPEVMNGIAFDRSTGDVYVTGKWWRSMFKFNIF